MYRLDRRQLLRTTAAGTAGLGLGGAASGRVPLTPNETVEHTFTATVESGFLTIDGDSAAGENTLLGRFDLSADQFDAPAEIAGEVYADGTWASTSVAGADLTDVLADIDLTSLLSDFIEGFSLVEFIASLDLDSLVETLADIVEGLELTEQEITTLMGVVEDLLASIGSGAPPDAVLDFVEDFLRNPDPGTIQSLLDLFGIETIEDILAMVGIEDLDQLDTILQEFLTNLDLEERLGDGDIPAFFEAASATVTTSGITGQFDPRGQLVTAAVSGLDVSLGFEGDEFVAAQLPIAATFTTGESGALTGAADGFTTTTVGASLVNNEFVLGLDAIDFGNTNIGDLLAEILDFLNLDLDSINPDDLSGLLDGLDLGGVLEGLDLSALGELITDEPGRHYAGFDLSMAFDSPPLVPSTLSGRVTDGDGNPLPDATVSVVDQATGEVVATVSPDANGDYEVSVPSGEYDVVMDADGRGQVRYDAALAGGDSETVDAGLTAGPPPLPGFESAPRDLDGDGLYENVRGDGETGIFDVQALFANLDDPTVQGNAEYFNFRGNASDEVTIFDVQALFFDVRE